jgi:hypothetical protein
MQNYVWQFALLPKAEYQPHVSRTKHLTNRLLCSFISAIWLLPRYNEYGTWPASGEIDLSEGRGNTNLTLNGSNIGTEISGSTLHFGPYWPLNGYENANFVKRSEPGQGFDQDFHKFQMRWTNGTFWFKRKPITRNRNFLWVRLRTEVLLTRDCVLVRNFWHRFISVKMLPAQLFMNKILAVVFSCSALRLS